MATKEEVVAVLMRCFDPEIPVNVYDLGLIYDIDCKPDSIFVTMSLTSTSCPSAQQLPDMIKARIQKECDVPQVEVRVVWEPVWSAQRITPEGRKLLHLDE